MVNTKAIGGIVLAIIVVILGASFFMNESDPISDFTEITDIAELSDTPIDQEITISDSAELDKNRVAENPVQSETSYDEPIQIIDSAILDKHVLELNDNNPDYHVDENGTKRYSISAKDSPDLGD